MCGKAKEPNENVEEDEVKNEKNRQLAIMPNKSHTKKPITNKKNFNKPPVKPEGIDSEGEEEI